MVRNVSQTMPKKTTVASGRWTSAPTPVESIIGTKPKRRDRPGHQHRPEPGEPGLLDRLALGQAVGHPVADVADEHQSFEHRRAGERHEADPRRDRERHPSNPEPEHAADPREQNAAEDHQGVAHRVERQIEKAQDQRQRQRDDDQEPRLGPLHVLELAAPFDPVVAVELDLRGDLRAGPPRRTSRCRGPGRWTGR